MSTKTQLPRAIAAERQRMLTDLLRLPAQRPSTSDPAFARFLERVLTPVDLRGAA